MKYKCSDPDNPDCYCIGCSANYKITDLEKELSNRKADLHMLDTAIRELKAENKKLSARIENLLLQGSPGDVTTRDDPNGSYKINVNEDLSITFKDTKTGEETTV